MSGRITGSMRRVLYLIADKGPLIDMRGALYCTSCLSGWCYAPVHGALLAAGLITRDTDGHWGLSDAGAAVVARRRQ